MRGIIGLRMESTETEVEARIRGSAPGPFSVRLLDRNLETVVATVRRCTDRWEDLVERALGGELDARDRPLIRCAAGASDLRRCLREEMPSLNRVVARVAAAVRWAECRRRRAPGLS